LTWIVTVPRQAPARKDVPPEGPVGVDSRPQPEKMAATTSAITI